MTLTDQVRELGRLLRNVEDAAARVQVMELEVVANEFADWARAATTLLTQVAIEQAQMQAGGRERTKTDPLGFEAMQDVIIEGRR